jgi:hypothetical protein
MIKAFVQSLGCVLGFHDPIREREKNAVLNFRCLQCYADLGPILSQPTGVKVVALSGWRRAPTAVATTISGVSDAAIARRS